MKRILVLAGLMLAAIPFASAQNARYSVSLPSISSTTTTPYLVANIPPNSLQLSVCNAPANQGPNIACTNYATTYNSAGTACPNGSQDTPDPQPSSCQSGGDAQGNVGFYAAPGIYDWTACVLNTTTCFGPYRVTLALNDVNGTCTMASGQCSAITFATAFKTTPTCVVTWTGTGTLTGLLSSQRSSSGLQPKSSVNSDTAVVDWKCQGTPN
jgi:hypothetical protein